MKFANGINKQLIKRDETKRNENCIMWHLFVKWVCVMAISFVRQTNSMQSRNERKSPKSKWIWIWIWICVSRCLRLWLWLWLCVVFVCSVLIIVRHRLCLLIFCHWYWVLLRISYNQCVIVVKIRKIIIFIEFDTFFFHFKFTDFIISGFGQQIVAFSSYSITFIRMHCT